MRLTIVGCGDAFCSGGRRQTSYLLEAAGERLLIDCGATTLMGLDVLGIDPNGIPAILISHLHGDHFGGLVWWIVHAQHVARRTVPLTIVGPPGIEARFVAAIEALFPGSMAIPRRYELTFREIGAGAPLEIGKAQVTAFEVRHPSGAPSHALRIEAGGRTLAFSGDTEWVESLVDCARGADLFLIECYTYDRVVSFHMSWKVIEGRLPRVEARRVMLTHMGREMLARRGEVKRPGVALAEDGMVVEV